MKDIKEFESQIVELEKQFTDAKAYNDIEMSEPVEMLRKIIEMVIFYLY